MNLLSRTFLKDAWAVLGVRLPVLAFFTLVSAVLEGATVASLLPLLSGFGNSTAGQADRVSQLFSQFLNFFGIASTPQSICILIVMLIMFSAVAFLIQSYLASRVQAFYIASWQRRMFSAFLAADYDFFVSRRSGDLVTAITNEPGRIGLVFSQLSLIFTALLFIAAQVAVSLLVAPIVVGFLLAFAVLLFVLTRWWAKRAVNFGSGLTVASADLMADTSEIIGGAKFVKATATESRALARLTDSTGKIESLMFGSTFDAQMVRAIFEYSGGLLVVALLVAGPRFLAVDIGAILVIVAIFVRLFPRITGLRQSLQIVDFHMPAFREAFRLLQEAEQKREVIHLDVPPGWPPSAPASIETENVSVAIGGRTILDRVNISIPPGRLVVFTGQTGAGKTTLLDCILGLRQPSGGTVKIDGHDLGHLSTEAWRRSIGYLGQDPILFNASIRENLQWISPEISDAEIYRALDAAAADFVTRLPQGLNTVVGDHGSRLSGGERQRIALARALLGAPRLLVLDEATSALDAQTEEIVTAALALLKGRMTIVAISHRPALVREADFVINLGNGRAERLEPQLAHLAAK